MHATAMKLQNLWTMMVPLSLAHFCPTAGAWTAGIWTALLTRHRHSEADARELEDDVRSSLTPEERATDLEKMIRGLGELVPRYQTSCLGKDQDREFLQLQ